MDKKKVPTRYIVCNVDGSTHQHKFRIHTDLATATAQASKLAKTNEGCQFMIMVPIGGLMYDDGKMKELVMGGKDES